jgi:hypothetical protein
MSTKLFGSSWSIPVRSEILNKTPVLQLDVVPIFVVDAATRAVAEQGVVGDAVEHAEARESLAT